MPIQPDENKLTARYNMLSAFEQKYGLQPTRAEQIFLLTAEPDEIVERFRENPGPGIAKQEIGGTKGTSGFGQDKTTSTENLVKRMVPVYRKAFEQVHGRKPSAAELEAVMTVGFLETRFGTAKFPGGVGPGMHNHGAVQAGKPPCDPDKSFLSEDSSPQGTGPNKKYPICFKRYPDDVAGAADLIKHVGKNPLQLMKRHGNSNAAFALGMYGNRYYESFNPPDSVKQKYAKVISDIQKAAGMPFKAKPGYIESLKRGTNPVDAARVLMYAKGLDGGANSIAKATGAKRSTQLGMKGMVSAKSLAAAGAGALAGSLILGPPGALLGAVAGFFGGARFLGEEEPSLDG